MTQNDIAYYNARKDAKDQRLRRKETKRHNLASEGADWLASQARMESAKASGVSAQAALSNADTRAKEYELEYTKEYGYKPGTKTTDVQFELYDPITSEYQRGITVASGYSLPKDWEGHPYVMYVGGSTPTTYREKIARIAQTNVESQKTGSTDTQKQIWDTIFTAGKTVNVVVDSAGQVIKITDALKTD